MSLVFVRDYHSNQTIQHEIAAQVYLINVSILISTVAELCSINATDTVNISTRTLI